MAVESSVESLVADIVGKHHGYARAVMAHLAPLAETVRRERAGDAAAEKTVELFEKLRARLEGHMRGEEKWLFPAIVSLARPESDPVRRASLRAAIERGSGGHEWLEDLLADLREASGGFAVPPGASRATAIFYRDLGALEEDLREHMHLEDDVLVPRALA